MSTDTIRVPRRTLLQIGAAAMAGSSGSDGDDDGWSLPDFDLFGDEADVTLVDQDGSIIAEDPTEWEFGNNLQAEETEDGVVLRATGESGSPWQRVDGRVTTDSPVDADTINRYRVWDSSGRAHGELTGENDAQVVLDAIADRSGTEGLILPDPGYPLDWEQELDIPANEGGFTIETVGMPKLEIPSDFTGDYAIHKPAVSANDRDNIRGYRLGGVTIDDSAAGQLSRGIRWDDIKDSVIRPCVFYDTPGILVSSSNHWSNQNFLEKPYVISDRGPAVEMEEGNPSADNPESDQNWIFAPHFHDKNNHTETAYIDHGRGNNWISSRCETADVVHLQDGASRYNIIEGQWDRVTEYSNPVIEQGDGPYGNSMFGSIRAQSILSFRKSRIKIPSTNLTISDGDYWIEEPIAFTQATLASNIGQFGLSDGSSGGSTGFVQRGFRTPVISLNTGATSGNTAEINTGGADTFGKATNPKLYLQVRVNDRTNVLVRVGCYSSSSDFAELIYDPTDSLSGSTHGSVANTSNWNVRVVTGGTHRDTVDSGIAPDGSGILLSIQRETGTTNPSWTAHIDETHVATIGNGGTAIPRYQPRAYAETFEAADKEVLLEKGRMYIEV